MSAKSGPEAQQSQPSGCCAGKAAGEQSSKSLLGLLQASSEQASADPAAITPEVLKAVHGLLRQMLKVVGNLGAPHPELEVELQEEYAKVKTMIQEGTVTKEEINHLHSLETRAHGHTEKGSLTAQAQSLVDRTRRPSPDANISGGNENIEAKLEEEIAKVEPKINEGTITGEEANRLRSLDTRAHGYTEKGSIVAHAQSVAARTGGGQAGGSQPTGQQAQHPEPQLQEEVTKVEPKFQAGTVTQDEADRLRSPDTRAHGYTEKGSVVSHAQSVAAKTEQLEEQHAKVDPKVDAGTVTKEEADRLHRLENRAHGQTDKGSVTAKAQSIADKNENTTSQSASGSAGATKSEDTTAQSTPSSTGKASDGAGKKGLLGLLANKLSPDNGAANDKKENEGGKGSDADVKLESGKGASAVSTTKNEGIAAA